MAGDVATGPGPTWFRYVLIGAAVIYFWGLGREQIHKLFGRPLDDGAWLRPALFFTQCTCLFPSADQVATEARLEVWQCESSSWKPIDPTPYFKIEADDKESRLQRLAYFYDRSRLVLNALDQYVVDKHASGIDDGVTGKIGGIRLYKVQQPIPAPGEAPIHYEFDPFSPVPDDQRKDAFHTRASELKARCTTP